jgi:hypothetical protein
MSFSEEFVKNYKKNKKRGQGLIDIIENALQKNSCIKYYIPSEFSSDIESLKNLKIALHP